MKALELGYQSEKSNQSIEGSEGANSYQTLLKLHSQHLRCNLPGARFDHGGVHPQPVIALPPKGGQQGRVDV